MLRRLLAWLGLALLLFSGVAISFFVYALLHDGPFGPIPGGPLESGSLREARGWSFAAGFREIVLEVRPSAPRSLTVWCLVHGGELYVPAAQPGRKQWTRQVEEDGRVRVRIEDALYERRAVRVDDAALRATLTAVLAGKYAVDVEEGYYSELAFFRLDPR